MIAAAITVSNIDYETCFASVFPKMIEKMKTMKNAGLAVRFLQKLGNDSTPILTDVLAGMKESEKNALLVWAGDLLEDRIRDTLNETLAGHELGRAIRIGSIDIRGSGTGISVIAENVTLDYQALASAVGSVGSLLSAVVGILPAKAEEQGCKLLNLPVVNEKIRGLLADWMKKNGLVMTVERVVVSPAAENGSAPHAAKTELTALPDELAESLLNAAVKYLKNTRNNFSPAAEEPKPGPTDSPVLA